MPDHVRGPLGWDVPARGLLIFIALGLGSLLAWDSRDVAGDVVDPVSLSVDANSAPTFVLGALPGIGPVLAGRILEARPYRSLDDLDRRVRGVGPVTLVKLRPYLRFDPPPVP